MSILFQESRRCSFDSVEMSHSQNFLFSSLMTEELHDCLLGGMISVTGCNGQVLGITADPAVHLVLLTSFLR